MSVHVVRDGVECIIQENSIFVVLLHENMNNIATVLLWLCSLQSIVHIHFACTYVCLVENLVNFV